MIKSNEALGADPEDSGRYVAHRLSRLVSIGNMLSRWVYGESLGKKNGRSL